MSVVWYIHHPRSLLYSHAVASGRWRQMFKQSSAVSWSGSILVPVFWSNDCQSTQKPFSPSLHLSKRNICLKLGIISYLFYLFRRSLISFTISVKNFKIRQEKCTRFQPYPSSYSILKIVWFYFINLGPDLPIGLEGQSMVPLGLGQAILGGYDKSHFQKSIYFLNCFNRGCIVTTLSKELSNPLSLFAAIPIPDSTARCISRGKMFNSILAL